MSLRPASLGAGKPGSSASSQPQFLSSSLMGQVHSESPTHRKLPFQTEEPLPASSSARSRTVGNSSAAYSRICLWTGRSRERRSKQKATTGNLACWPQDATAQPLPVTAPHSPYNLERPAPSLLPMLDQRSSPLGV